MEIRKPEIESPAFLVVGNLELSNFLKDFYLLVDLYYYLKI
jgi:hypothetical protein